MRKKKDSKVSYIFRKNASGSRLSKSKVVKESEKKDVHESNVAILDKMSDEQLEQERQELMEKLDPEIVKMLMNRKRAPKKLERTVEGIDGVIQNFFKNLQDDDIDNSENKYDGSTKAIKNVGLETDENLLNKVEDGK